MRTIVWVVIVGLFASALLAAQASASAPAQKTGAAEKCSANGQAAMRDCLSQKLAESATLLKQAEEQSLARIAKWNEDANVIKLAIARLQESNAAFKKFRTAHCAYASSLGGGAAGNAPEIRRHACAVDANMQRADQLKSAIASLPLT